MTAKIIPLRSPAQHTDEELLLGIADGAAPCLEELFSRYQDAVYSYLGHLTQQEQDLDDMLQATFLEVQRAAKHFKGRSQVKTWLFSLASHIAHNHARSEVRRRSFLARLAFSPAPLSKRPDELAERHQTLSRAQQALRVMSPLLRQVFVLCDLEDFSGEEVSQILSLPIGTVWRRLHEARKTLRAMLGENP